ncbi:MAG: DNA-directed RNA polymerase subunit beta, partial [Candidatus Aminicenantes bacterium]|nr:DNA-directed RNA polymerase subunit beta [Candidatus Aminicenantes bacterium]
MQSSNKYVQRVSFSRIASPVEVPDLLEIQKRSYHTFLQIDQLPENRKNIGIQAAFKSIFPISDFKETAILDFVSYSLGDWVCKCGALQSIENSMPLCQRCGAVLSAECETGQNSVCGECHEKGTVVFKTCELCGDRVRLKMPSSPEECLDKGFDYSIPLKVKLRLALYGENKKGERIIRDVKEQEIFFGEIPFMTEKGTFIINGTERVVVSQLQRSPGVYFMPGKSRGEFTAKIIPARGAWIELEEKLNLLQVRLDKKTKRINVTTFLKAMGLADDGEILKRFYTLVQARVQNGVFYFQNSRFLKDNKLTAPVLDAKGREVLPAGTKLTIKHIKDLEKLGIEYVPVDVELFEDIYAAADLEGVLRLNEAIGTAQIKKLRKLDCEFKVFFPESEEEELGSMLAYTLRKDKKRKDAEGADKLAVQAEGETEDKVAKNQGDAFIEVFKKMRPGEPVTLEGSRKFFENMIFDPKRYDLSSVGRMKLNIKLGFKEDFNQDIFTLTLEDMVQIVRYFLKLKFDRTGSMRVDDIDHLANRRIRAVGELVENAFRIGLMRLEKIIRERITNSPDISVVLPRELLNTKPVFAALKEFFGTSQLSQFMDQTNALAETTHKRRISALGPGGLNRERAGFEVRDVHSSHYGRICPIETPEGPNIGLISSLTTYARVNEYGFIETPYRKVEEGQVVDYFLVEYAGDSKFAFRDIVRANEAQAEVARLQKADKKPPMLRYHPHYLSAWEEEKYTIAQANAELDDKGRLVARKVNARKEGETVLVDPMEINYIDISPKQIVSISAALIPFLENDDANRALMGSNMQRQAVPLINPEAAIVATGMEHRLIKDSGMVVVCRRSGVVMNADAERIIVRVDADNADENNFSEIRADLYELQKFRRSNQNTIINQRPLVKVGERVERGQILCDGPASDKGELAMGRNILAAFVPWRGYNYEDAIILSERLVKTSAFNSIYIVEETIEARETKLGPEEITRDIPSVSEMALRNLDESGIVRIGAKVKPGEILVGKVSPKGETQLSPEEKLLRAIFGEQASEIKDSSLYCPPGVEGTVIDVKVFTRRGQKKDKRAEEIDRLETSKMERNFVDEKKILVAEKFQKIARLLRREKLVKSLKHNKSKYVKGRPIPAKDLETMDEAFLREIKKHISEESRALVGEVEKKVRLHVDALKQEMQEKIDQMKRGDEFAPGIIKIVKVLIAVNRTISVGDKMAGRHGNKGVVAKILPVEDMPFLADGRHVDIVLNPLGVPSRMNVGQVYEMILAWAGKEL